MPPTSWGLGRVNDGNSRAMAGGKKAGPNGSILPPPPSRKQSESLVSEVEVETTQRWCWPVRCFPGSHSDRTGRTSMAVPSMKSTSSRDMAMLTEQPTAPQPQRSQKAAAMVMTVKAKHWLKRKSRLALELVKAGKIEQALGKLIRGNRSAFLPPPGSRDREIVLSCLAKLDSDGLGRQTEAAVLAGGIMALSEILDLASAAQSEARYQKHVQQHLVDDLHQLSVRWPVLGPPGWPSDPLTGTASGGL